MSSSRHCLYYAVGGGMGHLTRALSLARQMTRLGGQHVVFTNSPHAKQVASQVSSAVKIVDIPSASTPGQSGAAFSKLAQELNPEILIVDSFPRGLGGELQAFLKSSVGKRVLISRGLPDEYVQEFGLIEFVNMHFDQVIGAGEGSPFESHPSYFHAAPFLIRNSDELPTRIESRHLLNANEDRAIVLFVASGNQAEISEAIDMAEQFSERALPDLLDYRLAVPSNVKLPTTIREKRIDHWPLIDVLPGVDFVVGNAGYNLYWETQLLNIPSLLFPQKRKYDDQASRANTDCCLSFEAIWDAISGIKNPVIATAQARILFRNGAVESARRLSSLVLGHPTR